MNTSAPGPRRIVVIPDANRFVMPNVCVVCGQAASQGEAIEQDRAPIPLPFVVIVRVDKVKLPYCDQHRLGFHKRFSRLHWFQGIGFALFLGLSGFASRPARGLLGVNNETGMLLAALGLISVLLVGASIFFVKPFLYDAKFTPMGGPERAAS